jgi:hypothetical protein
MTLFLNYLKHKEGRRLRPLNIMSRREGVCMKKITLQFLSLLFIMPLVSLALAAPVAAGDEAPPPADKEVSTSDFWGGEKTEQNIQDTIQLGERDPREIAAQVVNILLGFLGIVAVIIILAGGFKWMTAGGNQDKVDEAKKLMSAGIIGLVIVLAAFGIARFVIEALVSATTSS